MRGERGAGGRERGKEGRKEGRGVRRVKSLLLIAMKLWLAVAPLLVQQTSTFKQFTRSSSGRRLEPRTRGGECRGGGFGEGAGSRRGAGSDPPGWALRHSHRLPASLHPGGLCPAPAVVVGCGASRFPAAAGEAPPPGCNFSISLSAHVRGLTGSNSGTASYLNDTLPARKPGGCRRGLASRAPGGERDRGPLKSRLLRAGLRPSRVRQHARGGYEPYVKP